jgi:hypothetical protein
MSVLQLSISMWSVEVISPIVHMVVENRGEQKNRKTEKTKKTKPRKKTD